MLSSHSVRRWSLGGVTALVAALIFSVLSAVPASAGTVSGVLRDVDGVVLPGVTVTAGTVTGSTFTPAPGVATSVTGANGAFSLALADASTYRLQFDDGAAPYEVAYYAGSGAAATTSPGSAATISGAAASNLNAQLTAFQAANVTGTVQAAGAALEDALVDLGSVNGSTFTQSTSVATVRTDAAGAYAFPAVPAGTYVVRFRHPSYTDAYYTGAGATATTVPAQATSVTTRGTNVANGTTTLAVVQQGAVSGTVQTSAGTALESVPVALVALAGGAETPLGATNASGAFSRTGVAPGNYYLRFGAPADPLVRVQYYGGSGSTAVTTTGASTIVNVPANGTVANLNTRVINATISGTITSSNNPIAGVGVRVESRALNANGTFVYSTVGTTSTGANGTYSLSVPPGNYFVSFESSGFGTVYSTGADTTSPSRPAAPSPFPSNATTTRSANLTAANASIDGQVTSGTTPIQGVTVSAFTKALNANNQVVYTTVRTAVTNAQGRYSLGVPNGGYYVRYEASGFTTQFFDGPGQTAFFREDAELVNVSGATSTASASLSAVTGVLGYTTDTSGDPLTNVTPSLVANYTAAGVETPVAPALITSSAVSPEVAAVGGYFLRLGNGAVGQRYRLKFTSSDPGRATIYFPSGSVVEDGQDIVIESGKAIVADAVIPRLSTIAGKVSEPTGVGTNAAGQITAWREVSGTSAGTGGGLAYTTWRQVGGAAALASGNFSLNVPRGSYRLKLELFGAGATTDEVGFLPGLVGLNEAPSISVNAEQVVGGQQYQLPSRQNVRGSVLLTSGAPAPSGTLVTKEYDLVTNITNGVTDVDTITSTVTVGSLADGSYTMPVRSSRAYYLSAPSGPDRTYYPYPSIKPAGATVRPESAVAVVANGQDVAGITIEIPLNVTNLQAPWIDGVTTRGQTLTLNAGRWSRSDLDFLYEICTNNPPNPANCDWQVVTTSPASPNPTTRTTYPYRIPTGTGGPFRLRVTSFTPTGDPVRAESLTTGTSAPACNILGMCSAPNPSLDNRRAPIIEGRQQVGSTLTTDGGKWAGSPTLTYQWIADGAAIAGATASSFTPTAAQAQRSLRVRVTATVGSTVRTADSAPTGLIQSGTISNVTRPVLSGDAVVNKTLTVTPGTWSVPNPNFTYTWLANGQIISGATASTYTLTSAEVGKQVTARVTAVAPSQGSATALSNASAVVTEDPNDPTKLVNRTIPTITGTPKVGGTLTATSGTWSNSPSSFLYQWLANDVAIAGATTATYVPKMADLGKVLTVEVTARKSGFADSKAKSDPTAAVAEGGIENTSKPTISGTPAVGQTLTANRGTWTPAEGLTFAYQWLADGAAIAGQTGTTLLLGEGNLGDRISVRVTASGAGLTSASATSNETDAVQALGVTNVTAPAISGQARAGTPLTASTGSWNPATGLTFAYQWFADGVAIAGATTSTFTPTTVQVGKALTVEVTASRTGYASGKATSAPTAPVDDRSTITVTGGPRVFGSAEVGSILRVATGTPDPANAQVYVQWQRDGKPLSAKGTTYRLTNKDRGSVISARVAYVADGYDVLIEQANEVGPVTGGKADPAFNVSIKAKGNKTVITVSVRSGNRSAGGKIQLFQGNRELAKKQLKGGKASWTVKLKDGRNGFRVKYDGNRDTKSGSDRFNIQG